MSADVHERLDEVERELAAKIARRAKVRRLLDLLSDRIPSLRKRRRELKRKIKAQAKARPTIVIETSVVNQSERGTARPMVMVLHSTESDNREGNTDLAAIVSWFDNPAAQASSHVVTDADGRSARCVIDARKAWTQAAFNPVSLSIEQIGRASQSSWDDDELHETARWLALWSRRHSIPLVRGSVSGSTVTRAGVVTHAQLGAAGGGHTDPGSGYPVDRVIEMARIYRGRN